MCLNQRWYFMMGFNVERFPSLFLFYLEKKKILTKFMTIKVVKGYTKFF